MLSLSPDSLHLSDGVNSDFFGISVRSVLLPKNGPNSVPIPKSEIGTSSVPVPFPFTALWDDYTGKFYELLPISVSQFRFTMHPQRYAVHGNLILETFSPCIHPMG